MRSQLSHMAAFIVGLFMGVLLCIYLMRGQLDALAVKTAEVKWLQEQVEQLHKEKRGPE